MNNMSNILEEMSSSLKKPVRIEYIVRVIPYSKKIYIVAHRDIKIKNYNNQCFQIQSYNNKKLHPEYKNVRIPF